MCPNQSDFICLVKLLGIPSLTIFGEGLCGGVIFVKRTGNDEDGRDFRFAYTSWC